jgi:ElaB/YqjD/DUF883 family membrane-anchored ribosome-binding protein
MAADDQTLPEGTDTIIEGAGANDGDDYVGDVADTADAAAPSTSGTTASARDQFTDRYEALRGQAGDKARDFVQAGKDRATAAIDDVIQMIEDAAAEVDDKIGSQYGDYARRAAQGIATFNDSFKGRDVDALFDDARGLIQKSPAAAVGIAAALGFAVARLARSGVPDSDAPKA